MLRLLGARPGVIVTEEAVLINVNGVDIGISDAIITVAVDIFPENTWTS